MRTLSAVLTMLVLLLTAANAAPPLLLPTDATMGKTLAAYLQQEHQVEFEVSTDADPTGGTIVRVENSEKVGQFPFVMVSVPAETAADGKVTLRFIVLMVVSKIVVPDDKRAAVLELINRLNNDQDYTHMYIDEDKEIAFRWAVAVTPAGLSAENVWETYVRMLPAWEVAAQELAKVLK